MALGEKTTKKSEKEALLSFHHDERTTMAGRERWREGETNRRKGDAQAIAEYD